MEPLNSGLSRAIEKLTASTAFRAALPVLAAAAACFANIWLPFREGLVRFSSGTEYGSSLLAGIPNNNITWMMPLFKTAASAALNSGINPVWFFLFLHLAVYALVFCVGCLLRGYWAGILSIAGAAVFEAAAGYGYDDEQVFYSFFLMLSLALLLLKGRENTFKNSLFCGLAVGASMLVRSPLLLFPPVLVLLEFCLGGKRSQGFWARSLVFIAAAYILLVPWGLLNRSLSGKFMLVDGRRAASNLVTGAMGGVFTMEGDARKLAGLGANDSAIGFFAGELIKHPGLQAAAVVKRLWHIFLFSPVLFGLFLAAAAAGRGSRRMSIFALPAYFILVHSLMSIEKRYFYPMLYMLPPLIAGNIFRAGENKEPGRCYLAQRFIPAAFAVSMCFVAAMEALVLAYPGRAVRNADDAGYLAGLARRFPGEASFQGMRCDTFFIQGEYSAYYSCLGRDKAPKDPLTAFFLAARLSRRPSGLYCPAGGKMECAIISMLRELELGDIKAARASFDRAYSGYEATRNMLRGEPYKADKELALLIKRDSGPFWDTHVYGELLKWPPKSAAKILSRLKANIVFPRDSRLAALGDGEVLSGAGGTVFRMRAAGVPPKMGRSVSENGAAESNKLSDAAVVKIGRGDFKEAERLLLEALKAAPSNPQVLMNLCAIKLRENKRAQALEFCRGAADAVYFDPAKKLPALEMLASDAGFESYKLLKLAGRSAEAGEMLRRVAANAPPSWPGLKAAQAAVKNRD